MEQPYELTYMSLTTVSPTQKKTQELLEVMNFPENFQLQSKPKRKRRTKLEMQEVRTLESSRRLK